MELQLNDNGRRGKEETELRTMKENCGTDWAADKETGEILFDLQNVQTASGAQRLLTLYD
jgi:hypothetical protein